MRYPEHFRAPRCGRTCDRSSSSTPQPVRLGTSQDPLENRSVIVIEANVEGRSSGFLAVQRTTIGRDEWGSHRTGARQRAPGVIRAIRLLPASALATTRDS
jgi:hypothetical protein